MWYLTPHNPTDSAGNTGEPGAMTVPAAVEMIRATPPEEPVCAGDLEETTGARNNAIACADGSLRSLRVRLSRINPGSDRSPSHRSRKFRTVTGRQPLTLPKLAMDLSGRPLTSEPPSTIH
jgi:hypothetical protein